MHEYAQSSVQLAECTAALQVESDIKPFKGLLLGLFFISAGMEISLSAFYSNMPMIIGSLFALIVGKTALMFAAGIPFGLSELSAVRSGMYIAPGGEFAFVVLGEAALQGLLASDEMRAIFFMVVLSMALTPYLAVCTHRPHPPGLFGVQHLRCWIAEFCSSELQ
jgi:Kef-type K+ transport system membrane component KefB